MDKRQKLRKLLERELDSSEKGLFQLVSLEQRRDSLIVRMPTGVIALTSLWEKIKVIAEKNLISVSQAPVYATLEELDEVLGDVKWLWKDWIPKGFVSLLCGDPGVGKTMIAIDFARILTTGDCWPMETKKQKAGKLIWIDAEAGQQILRERSISLGVDRSKVLVPVIEGDILNQPDFSNSEHKAHLVSMVKSNKPEMVVLDSLGGANRRGENKVEDVKPLLEFFATLARNENLSALILHHLNKGMAGEATEVSLYRIRGSTAIPAYARSVMALEQGKSADELKLRIIKNNLARFAQNLSVISENNSSGSVKKITYKSYKAPPNSATQKQKCADWIEECLKLEDTIPLKEIIENGETLGFSRQVVYLAKDILGDYITVTKDGRKVFWSLSKYNEEELQQIIKSKK